MFRVGTSSKSRENIGKYKINGLPIFFFPGLLTYPEVFHFITTREGGYSAAPFHTFNLALHVGDKEEDVLKNRSKLAQSLPISPRKFITSEQVHGTKVSIIGHKERESSAFSHFTTIETSDAMITDQEDLCLLIFVADCVPVFLFDYRKHVIALIHAGWKGTVGLITQKTVYQMQSHWGCEAQDIICAIGPSIGPCCYQVGSEVITRVREVFPTGEDLIRSTSTEGKGYFNLWQANKIQLRNCQIPEKNIEVAGLCTCCNDETFFSSRKDGGTTGRFAAGMMLRKQDKSNYR